MTTLGSAQVGVKAETTYGTPVTVDRFYPYLNDGLEPDFGVISAADEIRAGSLVERADQDDPYPRGASGPFELYVPTKGFGLMIAHALGNAAVGTITDSNYTQTHTLSATGKNGKSLTYQASRPFNPAGTPQQFTFHGVKLLSMELSVETEGYWKASFDCDAEEVDTSTALATATYPSLAAGAGRFPWKNTTFTIAGTQVEARMFRCKVTWPMNVDRRYLRGSALKKEPTPTGKPTIEWEAELDFTDLTQYNRFAAATIATRTAQLIATVTGNVALAGATVPQLVLTLPAARFDAGPPTVSGEEPLMQTVSGVGLDDGTNPPITITYRSTDSAV